MAEAVLLSRVFVFANHPLKEDEAPQGLIQIPLGTYVDEATADVAMRQAAELHMLAKGVIVVQGKPIMTVEQYLGNLGVIQLGLSASKSRVRESSLLIVPGGSIKT